VEKARGMVVMLLKITKFGQEACVGSVAVMRAWN
jgi:hypothetical protein